MSKIYLLAVSFSTFVCCGCLSRQVARDGMDVRQAILDMYTDQVMDNLIRANNNMPFVQLKYSSIQVNDQHDLMATGALDQTITTVRNLIVAAATKTVANDTKGSVTGDCKRTMNFTADPVTDSNDVYDKYIKFVDTPGQFFVTDRPPPLPVHIMRKSGHRYYWVPCEAGRAFRTLCMDTTFKRGKAETPSAVASYSVTVQEIDNSKDHRDEKPPRDAMDGTIVFTKKIIPRGPASMILELKNGRKITLDLIQEEGKNYPQGELTDRFTVSCMPKAQGFVLNDLVKCSARVYSRYFPPETQGPPTELVQINNNLNSILVQLQNQAKTK